jgi:HK97 family phage portal protein
MARQLFRHQRDKPSNRAGNGQLGMIHMGATAAGKPVNEFTALSLSAVFACVRVLSEDVAAIPLHTYRYKEDGDSVIAREHPLYVLLHDAPNPEMTSFSFRQSMMVSLLLWGNAYAQIVRDGRGQVTALYPLAPNRVTLYRDKLGALVYNYQRSDPEEASPEHGQQSVTLPAENILHIVGLGFDGLMGLSPLALSRDTLGLALAAQEYGARYFSNSGLPSGTLETDKIIKDKDRLREDWMRLYGGTGNAGRTAILEEGLHFNPISSSPEEAQLLDTRKFSVTEIGRIFRIPPHLIGDLDKATFSNIEHMSLEYVKFTLMPWVRRWEDALCQKLLLPSEKRDYGVRFNVDGLMRGDYATRMAAYASAIQNGFMSPNDVRRLENMNRIPGEAGDRYYFNGTLCPIERAGAAYEAKGGETSDA